MLIRVLLADDHAMVRQGLKVLLENRGVQVICEAGDGEEALHLAKEFRPDTAILDRV
jgi:DNA-binding NarL/FixJ family response regulator